jgi:uncharacterized membrane protein YbhN (UPF0104 family)
VINYNLGQGAIVAFTKRARGLPLGLGTGTVLLIIGTNLVVLLVLAAVGLSQTSAPRATALWPWVLGLLAGFAVYLVVVALKPRFLARYDLFKPAFKAGVLGHLAAVLIRMPHLGLVFFAHWLTMRAYGIDPPLAVFLSFMPVVSFISAIPISPQGLGTAQVAAVFFFAPYAVGDTATREATILAYSLTTSVLATLFMLTMGLIWFRAGMRLLGLRSLRDAAADETSAEGDEPDSASEPDADAGPDPEAR